MTDKFYPLSLERLYTLFVKKSDILEGFGFTNEMYFSKESYEKLQTPFLGEILDTPYGVAAGPHTQMSQNIIVAWMSGARYIELKTVQVLDELEIVKPCIDMQDEGYNCEWSQELKIQESFNEYLNAWILIHLINHLRSKNKASKPGVIFNMSVGYNFEGVLSEKVQWFFDKMNNCAEEKKEKIESLSRICPEIKNVYIPDCISNSITLSTMHGCPPDEIEKITRYLIEERKLNTILKLNPTLIGKDVLQNILNKTCGFYTDVPDIAFEHDLKYDKAIEILNTLLNAAEKNNVFFGVKLTNTLECLNNKTVFPAEQESMYMSGRSLHPISISLAKKLQSDFGGKLNITFSAGADCFNMADVLSCGLYPVTVCSDILKPGGYGRLLQYADELSMAYTKKNAISFEQFILSGSNKNNISEAALSYLEKYANQVVENPMYKNDVFSQKSIKTSKKLSFFDCIEAPCTLTCPTHQDIPEYLYHASKGDFLEAYKTVLRTNPFPNVLGMVCDHKCQSKCTRVNYDEELRIRDVKWFVTNMSSALFKKEAQPLNGKKAAVIGAGPSGLSCAYFLKLAGVDVTIYESKSVAGGMVSEAIPNFRLKKEALLKDIEMIERLGVKINYNSIIDKNTFEQIKKNCDFVYIAVGAQTIKKLGIDGEDANGVIDPIVFLSAIKNKNATAAGKNIAVIGGGNTAVDVARTASRLLGDKGSVTLVYRRSILEMPADKEEIEALLTEGIAVKELTAPQNVVVENGKVVGLACIKMRLGKKDSSGRSRPEPVENSAFIMDFDTIIPAVGQDVVIDFIDEKTINELYDNSFSENIFMGGDALRGASTIVRAVGDGRLAAEKIINTFLTNEPLRPLEFSMGLSYSELLNKKSKRVYSELPKTVLHKHGNEAPEMLFQEKDVVVEAERCLFCNEMCNVCVTVCPNKANYCYVVNPFKADLPKITVKDGEVKVNGVETFNIKQKYQIINIGDFCNECGNCNTFCPTSGAPYLEKPKFYLSTESFNKVDNGFFISKYNNKTVLVYKKDNVFTTLTFANNKYLYETEVVSVEFNEVFEFKSITPLAKENDTDVSLSMAAVMRVLMDGAKNLF